MHYRDSRCPVPPSYVYLQVSLTGLVHWGVQDTVKYGTIESYVTCRHAYVTRRHNIYALRRYECDTYLS